MESEFAGILDFLENEEKKLKNNEGSHNENPQVIKLEIIENQQLIAESKITENVQPIISKVQSSSIKGFDVGKLKFFIKKELISDLERAKKYQSKEFLGVHEILTCPRKVYFARKDYKINFDEEFNFTNLIFIREAGKIIHKIIQKIYGFDKTEETVISKKFRVKGKVDGIENISVVELKTIDRDKYEDTYQNEHYFQGLIYAYILNTEYDSKIENISIVYIFRDLKSDPFVYNLPIDNSKAQIFLNKALSIHDCIEKNIVPPIDDIPKNECTFCSYKKYCRNEENKLKNDIKIESKPKSKFVM